MEIANCAQIEVRGQSFVTFDVAMQGHVISTIDAPLLSGRILWSHAAIHGYRDFDLRERTELEVEVGRILIGDNTAENGERDERPVSWH
ncbi:MAG: hypothetical protein KJ981_20880 [Alphaproteobacteria bacterium]|nr:hypothetical protein [Alphaproteobacteria bacterium]MBU0794513.1 hypothetical protein [Alphaproteobacteria bacterium]MBU0831584.1 hypothetical protein [Alphaproteobacteria bacterium]MBU1766342.1 hypothetical protein [Alphaproteobacteria bacterium]